MEQNKKATKWELFAIIYVIAIPLLMLIKNTLEGVLKLTNIIYYFNFMNLAYIINVNVLLNNAINGNLIILTISIVAWVLLKRRDVIKSILNEIRPYFHISDFIYGLSIGFIILIALIKETSTNPTFFIDVSAIYFTLAGFSFTAGSFLKEEKVIRSDFFRLSTLLTLIGFMCMGWYLFYDIVLNIKDPNVGPLVVIFLLTLGLFSWVSFKQLLLLLNKVSKSGTS